MVKTTVLEIISEITGIEDIEDIKLGMSLRYDLNMEEVEIDDLLEEAEAEFDIDLFTSAPDLETVNDVIDYIKSQL